MVNVAARKGVDAETCLLGAGVTELELHDPEMLIAREQEMRLIENLVLALPEVPALGFELRLQYKVSTFGIWGFVMRTSRNLREAFASAIRTCRSAFRRWFNHAPGGHRRRAGR